MAITVLNTDAGLSGKTIINLEDTQTITGQKTFDRDPSAPFVVTSGSAKVSNLNADQFDGLNGAEWASYTVTNSNITTGDGTVAGEYFQVGKTVHYRIIFIFGSTSSFTGAIEFGLPVACELTATAMPLGYGTIFDASTGFRYMIVLAQGSSNVLAASYNVAAPFTATNSTAPVTFASSDQIIIYGTYKANAAL